MTPRLLKEETQEIRCGKKFARLQVRLWRVCSTLAPSIALPILCVLTLALCCLHVQHFCRKNDDVQAPLSHCRARRRGFGGRLYSDEGSEGEKLLWRCELQSERRR